MSLADVFDTAFRLYRRNFVVFAGIVASIQAPVVLLAILVNVQFGVYRMLQDLNRPGAGGMPDIAGMLGALSVISIQSVLSSFVLTLQTAALTLAISERHLDRPADIATSLKWGLKRILPLFVTWLVLGIIIGLAFYLVLIVVILVMALLGAALAGAGPPVGVVVVLAMLGVMLALCFAFGAVMVALGLFVTQIVTIEGTGYWEAVQRNLALVRGSFKRLVIAGFALGLLVYGMEIALVGTAQLIIMYGVAGPLHLSTTIQSVTTVAIEAVVSMFIMPYWMTCLTILYYDQRVRKEGFDLALLEWQVATAKGAGHV